MARIGRPTKMTPKVIDQIAELFFLAFSDEQVALATDVDVRTIHRARAAGFCQSIKKGELAREKTYRQKIWDGKEGWQGAAWFLERKYPERFSRPEVQLQINTTNQTINQTLIVTAEVAGLMASRVKNAEKKVDQMLKLKSANPPPAKNGNGNLHPEAKT